ncbi:DUF3040 domain-containing protein [Streptomyces sp. NPDC002405]
MPGTDDKLLSEIAARVYRDDPRFARALRAGRPFPPREYRRTRAWPLFALALVALGTGITLDHGLLIVTGMVLAGMAAELCDPRRTARRPRIPPPRS